MFRTRERGFALATALFIVAVLATVGAALLSMNEFFSKGSSYEILEDEAFFAGRAGLDYGLYMAEKGGVCQSSPQTISLPAMGGGFKATFSCSQSTQDEAGTIETFITVSATGCNTTGSSCPDSAGVPSSGDYAQRTFTATMRK